MPRRRADKIDANQPEIVKALRQIPCVTVETGKDDIIVGYKGRSLWYEIKTPECVGKDGQIRKSAKKPDQIRLENEFTGHYRIIWSIDQILDDIKAIKAEHKQKARELL